MDVLKDITNTVDDDFEESCTGSGTSHRRSEATVFFSNQAEKKRRNTLLLEKKATRKENLAEKFPDCDSDIQTKDNMGSVRNTQQSMKKMGISPQQKTTGKKNLAAFKVKNKPSRDMNLKEKNQQTIPTEGTSDVCRSMTDKEWATFFNQVSSSQTDDNEVS